MFGTQCQHGTLFRINRVNQDARLDVSRLAARLFLERGVAGTRAKDIAARCGISRRTFWRHFRSKERALEPLLEESSFRLVRRMRGWRPEQSIESLIDDCFQTDARPRRHLDDDLLSAQLIARLPHHPGLHEAWLMAHRRIEAEVVPVVARRSGREPDDFQVRLCASSLTTAMRTVDEHIADRVLNQHRLMTLAAINRFLADAIRAATHLPICDPLPAARSTPTLRKRH